MTTTDVIPVIIPVYGREDAFATVAFLRSKGLAIYWGVKYQFNI